MITMRSVGLARSGLWLVALACGCGDDTAALDAGDTTGPGTTSGGDSSTTMVADSSSSAADTSTTSSAATTVADTSGSDESSSSTGTPNSPPVAVDDLYVMVMDDAPLALAARQGVVVNDSDPDGDPITVTDFDALSQQGGAVAVQPDGALTFTPSAGFWGEDGFEYTIDDGNGGSATARVRLMVTPTTVSLGQVTAGIGGFTIEGNSGEAGWSVGGGGDVDGDGHADVLVGAVSADVDGTGEGRAFVVFGKSDGETVALADVLAGEGGFAIDGDADTDQAGFSIAHAGDVNGDGLADVVVGAPQANAVSDDEGRAYVVFGKPDGDAVALETLAADGAGFVIDGIASNDLAGTAVAGAVDVNGDGLDDLIVGAPQANVGGVLDAGRAWVVFGKADTDPVLLADLDGGAGGFTIDGIATDDHTGAAVAGGGDVNGDGLEDIIIGVPYANPAGGNSGRAYVVFGKSTTTPVDLADVLGGSGGFTIAGIAALDLAGAAVAGGGDVNGDGLCDVVIGALGAEGDLGLQGRSFVVFGKSDGTAVLLADVVTGTGGFLIEGEVAGDFSGWSVAAGGDRDGDGLADVVIGAQGADFVGFAAGRTYAVSGRLETMAIALGEIASGMGGFAIDGEADQDLSGWSVANASDVSADGFADLVIGAPQDGGLGRAYVVFGGDFDASIALVGTPGDDELFGTDDDETIVGGDGADTLHAMAGFDTVYGGRGDDLIALTSPNFFRIDGGLGFDTIVLEGDGLALDLPAYFEPAIAGIEGVDLTGTGDNTLFLETRDLRALSKTSNTLIVVGDEGDQVVAELGAAGFADLGSANGFAAYSDGVVTLLVADAVEVFVSL